MSVPNKIDVVAFAPGRISDHSLALAGRFLFEARLKRTTHFDDFAGTDGAFSMLLGLFVTSRDGEGVDAERTLAFADSPLSTAIYIRTVLIEGGWIEQLGRAGSERYTLSHRAEQTMRCYLGANVPALHDAAQRCD